MKIWHWEFDQAKLAIFSIILTTEWLNFVPVTPDEMLASFDWFDS